ncbi:hypothetical protein Nazgul33 [Burkholderia phage BcepNazgul]|uniref:Uncharacterized protein n=1 Tax=Burkholderia phage BcepNazgul TaxID=242861 RepID=Q6UYK7_9CAUD|nr:hypothetical protein Nazgul33 [Burkholderia phage BcepNazgul]AAQ63334.1 hypothetical protein Nazgul33 [Burkholderia phage BcepNazgul]
MARKPLKITFGVGAAALAMNVVRRAIKRITEDPYEAAAEHLKKTLEERKRPLLPGERVVQKSPLFEAPYGVWEFDRGDEVTVDTKFDRPWVGVVLKRNPDVPRMYVVQMAMSHAEINVHERMMSLRRRAAGDPNRAVFPAVRPCEGRPAGEWSTARRWPPTGWPCEWFPPGKSDAYATVSQFRRDYPEAVDTEKEQAELAIAAAGLAMCHDPCYVVQYGDQTVCKTCGTTWDTNDQFPPSCPHP